MASVPLQEFVAAHREEIIQRCRANAAARTIPPSAGAATGHGVPLFLDQLVQTLDLRLSADPAIGRSAGLHGRNLLLQQSSVGEVVKEYADIRQSIAALAVEMDAPISADDCRTLNRCLDDAIEGAVTEYGRERSRSDVAGESARGRERLGFLAHELGNLMQTAMLASELLKAGNAGTAPGARDVLHRSIMGMRALISSSLAETRLTPGLTNRERFQVSGLIQEVAPAATLEASARGITFVVASVEPEVEIEADRQVIAAVVGNLLKNAFQFTQPRTTVTLRVGASAARVLIQIQDECGGLSDGNIKKLRRGSGPRGARGSGLGLWFSQRGVEANDGRISAQNLPQHQGCVFTIDLPRVPGREAAAL